MRKVFQTKKKKIGETLEEKEDETVQIQVINRYGTNGRRCRKKRQSEYGDKEKCML